MISLDEQFDIKLGEMFDAKLDQLFAEYDKKLDTAGVQLSNADRVTPGEKKQLSGLLKYYAKKPKPFTSCVNDNRKRFGDKAEGVCAVLKDIIRGTTKWRGKDNPRDHGTPGVKMSDEAIINTSMYKFLAQLGDLDLNLLLGLAELAVDGEKAMTLDYPIAAPENLPISEKDQKFLTELHGHHAKRLSHATKYASDAEAHPDVVRIATDAVSDSAHQMARINRMKKTGRPY